jgi:eukaryotic-like serine/threonine-protein kinase
MKFEFKKLKTDTPGGLLLHLVLAISILLVLFLLYFYTYLPQVTNHGETITVPSIEGLAIQQADDELSKRTLRYEINDSTYTSDYPPLTVIRQYPPAGAKVKEGRKIFISINRTKPPSVPVPNLIDGSVLNADAVLRSNQLIRGRIELVPGPFNIVKEMKFQGRIIEPLTRVPKGSVIDLVVMDGGSTVEPTPDVIGYDFSDARFAIIGSNLVIGKVTLLRDTAGQQTVVIKQNPAEGQNIRVGDAVDLWIGLPQDLQKLDDQNN